MAKSTTKENPLGMRLQKFLSDAGVASRRRAEELIEEGRVLVNNEVVDTLPAFIDPARDEVIVNGAPVKALPLTYYIVHKPKGVVCSNRDPAGRRRAVDFLPPMKQRLFPVGRLDEDSSGLLLMTNDGELSQQITHPRYGVPKVYQVEVRGHVTAEVCEQLRKGIFLAEGKARAAYAEITRTTHDRSILKITLREGRNRQVRRMLAKLGFPVRSLKRLEIGPLTMRGLPIGGARKLTVKEVAALRTAVAEMAAKMRPRRRKTGAPAGDRKQETPKGRTRKRVADKAPTSERRRIIG